MSHKLFSGSILSNARVWAFLKRVDEAEAEACREAGYPRCGGDLHSARYPRKPHGLAPGLLQARRRAGAVRRKRFCHERIGRSTWASLGDFYREMGELFGIALITNSRWASFKGLRERWLAHLDDTVRRFTGPVAWNCRSAARRPRPRRAFTRSNSARRSSMNSGSITFRMFFSVV